MNRAMIIGGMGIVFLGLGLVGTNLMPSGFLAKADSVPSLGQLIEKSSLLDRKSARITSRLALKQELMQLWRSGVIEIAEMFDNWVWLNSHEPLHAPAIDFDTVYNEAMAYAKEILPMVADVSRELNDAHGRGENLLFEGAQGTLLDVDHGT